MSMTKHAVVRAQQRAIPQLIIDLGIQFGAVTKAGNGAYLHYFDRRAKRQLEAYGGEIGRRLAVEYANVYVVTSNDGQVVTTGRRSKHIERDRRRPRRRHSSSPN